MPLQEQDKVFINPITVEKNGRILEEETIEISIKKKKIKEHSILRSEYIDTIIDTASLHPSSMVAIATNKVKDYPEFATFKEAEIYLLGLILTDAYYTKTGGIEIYQSAKKKFIPEKITEALDSLGYKYSFAERDRGGKQFTWRIAKESADHFKELFGLGERNNPSFEFIFLPNKLRYKLLLSMMDGDGTWNNKDFEYGVFYKPHIIDFFQVIAMSLGYKGKINRHRKQIYISLSGFLGTFNFTIPQVESWKHPVELFDIQSLENYPIIKDNGKIFLGG